MRSLSMVTHYGDEIDVLSRTGSNPTLFPVSLMINGKQTLVTTDEARMLSFFFERIAVAQERLT